jgi:hypothetical protein
VILQEAANIFNQARTGDLPFMKSATEEQIDLIDTQRTLELKSHRKFVGKF